jgi:Lrp/AsnC family leucine-responsive transcriptional regulator
MLKVAAASMDAFEEIIDRLALYGQPSSTMVLSTPLGWRPVFPVDALAAATPDHSPSATGRKS